MTKTKNQILKFRIFFIAIAFRDSTITEDFLKDFSNYCVRNEKHDHDMEFICADGTVPFYQVCITVF